MKSAPGPSAFTSFDAQSAVPLYSLMPPLPSICSRVFTTSIGIVIVSATQLAKPPYARPFKGDLDSIALPRRRRVRCSRIEDLLGRVSAREL